MVLRRRFELDSEREGFVSRSRTVASKPRPRDGEVAPDAVKVRAIFDKIDLRPAEIERLMNVTHTLVRRLMGRMPPHQQRRPWLVVREDAARETLSFSSKGAPPGDRNGRHFVAGVPKRRPEFDLMRRRSRPVMTSIFGVSFDIGACLRLMPRSSRLRPASGQNWGPLHGRRCSGVFLDTAADVTHSKLKKVRAHNSLGKEALSCRMMFCWSMNRAVGP
jgi:hypothetical protein